MRVMMRTRFLALLVGATLACTASAQVSRDASIGTWPFLVGNMDGQIQSLVDTSVANGLDSVYVNVFRASGPRTGTLWVDDAAGTWNGSWGPVRPSGTGIDLVRLIAAAHAKNLQVVAVIKCFDTSVSPNDPSHRQYLLDVIDYFVRSYDTTGKPIYDLDGVALDYVRFVGSSTANPAPVTAFVADVKQRLGALTLHAYVLAGRYTLDGPNYDSVFNSYQSVINQNTSQYGQHWEQLAQHVDVLLPMAYSADGTIYQGYASHLAYVRTATQYARTACQRAGYPNRRVVTAIRCWTDSSETATVQSVDASARGAMLGGGDGYQAFRYRTMQAAWWPALALYAAPGANRPIPGLTTTVAGMGVRLDATASRDNDEAPSGLRIRFDWDGDGRFDTARSTQQTPTWLARNPGTWRIGMEVTDSTGVSGVTTREVRIGDPLRGSPGTVSAAAGGSVQFTITAGADAAGTSYALSGALAGSVPGTPIAPGFVLPLNVDGLTWALVAAANTPLFANSIGVLDASGGAVATLNLAPGLATALVGRVIHVAAAATQSASGVVFVTNAAAFLILP